MELAAFRAIGFTPSLSKVAAMWGGTPVTVRLDDLDKICAALDRTVGDLLQAEPLAATAGAPENDQRAVGAEAHEPSPVPAPGSTPPGTARQCPACRACAQWKRRHPTWVNAGGALTTPTSTVTGCAARACTRSGSRTTTLSSFQTQSARRRATDS